MKALLSLSLIVLFSQSASANGVTAAGKLIEEAAIKIKGAATHAKPPRITPKTNLARFEASDALKRAADEVKLAKKQAQFAWPKDNATADFEKLSEFVLKNLSKEAKLKKKKVDMGSVEWTGPKKIRELDLEEKFSWDNLDYHNDHGRDVKNVIFSTVINAGIVQGAKSVTSGKEVKDIKILIKKLEALSTLESPAAREEIVTILKKVKNQLTLLNRKLSKPLDESKLNIESENKDLTRAFVEMTEEYYDVAPVKNISSKEFLTQFINSQYIVGYEQGRRIWLRDEASSLRSLDTTIDMSLALMEMGMSSSKSVDSVIAFSKITFE